MDNNTQSQPSEQSGIETQGSPVPVPQVVEQGTQPVGDIAPQQQPEDARIVIPEDTRKKYASLESKNAEYKKQLEEMQEARKTLDAINSIYKNSPEAYEVFRKNYINSYGVDPGDHSKLFPGSQQRSLQTGNTIQQGQPNIEQPAFDTETVVQEVERKLEAKRSLERFFEKYPDYNVNTVDQSSPEYMEKYNKLENLAAVADAIQQRNPSMTTDQALERALYTDPDYVKKIQEQGEFTGMANAYAKGAGNTPNISTQASSQTPAPTIQLTQKQQLTYNKFLKEKGKDFADKYIARLSQK